MGWLPCPLCGEDLLGLALEEKHVCDHEKIRKNFEELDLAARTAEYRLRNMQNAVMRVFQEIPSLEGDKVEVSTIWLRRLWNVTKSEW